jgi:hypothetical protein
MAQEHVLISDSGTRIPVNDAFFKESKTLVNAVSHATDEAEETLVPFKTNEVRAALKVFALPRKKPEEVPVERIIEIADFLESDDLMKRASEHIDWKGLLRGGPKKLDAILDLFKRGAYFTQLLREVPLSFWNERSLKTLIPALQTAPNIKDQHQTFRLWKMDAKADINAVKVFGTL